MPKVDSFAVRMLVIIIKKHAFVLVLNALSSNISTELANTMKNGRGVLFNFVFIDFNSKRFPATLLRFTELNEDDVKFT